MTHTEIAEALTTQGFHVYVVVDHPPNCYRVTVDELPKQQATIERRCRMAGFQLVMYGWLPTIGDHLVIAESTKGE